MNFLISSAFAAEEAAQTAASASGGVGAANSSFFFMLLIFVVVFYFLLIRPQAKRAKEHRQLISNLAKGDEVVTNGGVLGKVNEIENDLIHVSIAKGVVVTVQKAAISATLPKGTLKLDA